MGNPPYLRPRPLHPPLEAPGRLARLHARIDKLAEDLLLEVIRTDPGALGDDVCQCVLENATLRAARGVCDALHSHLLLVGTSVCPVCGVRMMLRRVDEEDAEQS